MPWALANLFNRLMILMVSLLSDVQLFDRQTEKNVASASFQVVLKPLQHNL